MSFFGNDFIDHEIFEDIYGNGGSGGGSNGGDGCGCIIAVIGAILLGLYILGSV